MVVGAQQVDGGIRATLALVQVVGDVAREVRGLAVRLDEDAVLVVTVGGRAQPHRATLVKDLAALTQALDRRSNRAGGVQGLLVEEHVEVCPEGVQTLLDLREHQLDAASAEDLNGLFFGQGDRVGLAGRARVSADLVGNVGDVLAAVSVLGDLAAHDAGIEGVREAVDLRAVVVEVVLAGHGGAGGGHEAGQRVADSGPAGATQVHGASRVRGHVLEVDRAAREGLVAAERGAGLDDGTSQLARRTRAQADVDEAGASDLDRVDTVSGGQVVGEDLRELARRHASLLTELHRDVGRPVAMLAHARALHGHGVGDQRRIDRNATGGGSVQQGRADESSKFFRSHPFRLRCFCSYPRTLPGSTNENLATRGAPGWLSSRREGREASNISGSRIFFYL